MRVDEFIEKNIIEEGEELAKVWLKEFQSLVVAGKLLETDAQVFFDRRIEKHL